MSPRRAQASPAPSASPASPDAAPHPRHELDERIHSPVRLSVMATLAAAGEVDFRFLRESLQVSDSLLSKHAAQLEACGYVRIVKGFIGKKAGTWYALTDEGRAAFARYRATLAQILEPDPASVPVPAPADRAVQPPPAASP